MTRYLVGLTLVAVLAGCKTDETSTSQDISNPSTPVAGISNTAPVISGVPARKVDAGRPYNFKPVVHDPNGDPLTFSIDNKPLWAQFNAATGELSGAPAPDQVGRYDGIMIAVSDGKTRAAMPGFSIDVVDADLTPSIEGSPASTVTVGTAYDFTPGASDPGGAALTFSIENKPSWANFDEFSGRLWGTPDAGDVGTAAGIIITVSNGTQSQSLPQFAVAVQQAGTAQGSATLSWVPPSQNTDGSALTNLAGYKIYYGTDAGSLNKSIKVQNPGISAYVISSLAADTWYFAIKAYSASGESDLSQTVSKVIR